MQAIMHTRTFLYMHTYKHAHIRKHRPTDKIGLQTLNILSYIPWAYLGGLRVQSGLSRPSFKT